MLQEVGEALQEGQAYDDARFTFAKLRDLAGHNGDAFGRINATLHLGQVEEARGNAAEAVKVYEGVVSEAKAGSWLEREARARIEQLYRSQEDLPGLSDYYKKWLADHPRDLEVATRRAAVLVELNRRDEAIDLLKQAASWAPDRQELQVELARRLGEADRPAEAAAVMEKLTAAAPEEKSYWVLLGDARWQLLAANPPGASAADKAKWRQGALDAWAHLALPDSRDGVEAGNLADLLAGHHLPDEALAQYARGAALSPELIDLRERWASYLVGLGRRDEARTVLAGIVTASPKKRHRRELLASRHRFGPPRRHGRRVGRHREGTRPRTAQLRRAGPTLGPPRLAQTLGRCPGPLPRAARRRSRRVLRRAGADAPHRRAGGGGQIAANPPGTRRAPERTENPAARRGGPVPAHPH